MMMNDDDGWNIEAKLQYTMRMRTEIVRRRRGWVHDEGG